MTAPESGGGNAILIARPLRQIARELEARGYRTKTNQTHWHPQRAVLSY
jgi:hypothetical protein